MPRPSLTSSLLFAALLLAQPVAADETGYVEEDPHEACRAALLDPHSRIDGVALEPCRDFFDEVRIFRGTRSVITVDQGQGRVAEQSICLPAYFNPYFWVGTLNRWRQDHPKDLQDFLEAGLVAAVVESYPCDGPWDPDAERPGVERALATTGERIPHHCPLCGSHQVRQIVYGLPGPDFDTTRFYGGGCIGGGRGAAKWHCSGCGHMWGLQGW